LRRSRLGARVLIVALAAAVPLPSASAAPGRIEVGSPVPGIVALVNRSAPLDNLYAGQFCGAVVTGVKQVTTAAHCVAGRSTEDFEVVIDVDELCPGMLTTPERVAVTSIDVASDPARDGASDLAHLTVGAFVGAPLPVGDVGDDEIVTAYGWGRPDLHSPPSCRLTHVQLQVSDGEECQTLYKGLDRRVEPNHQFCAAPLRAGAGDTCIGDSGGPVLAARGDTNVVVGITSYGSGCDNGTPGVYERARN
jgi:trypsin